MILTQCRRAARTVTVAAALAALLGGCGNKPAPIAAPSTSPEQGGTSAGPSASAAAQASAPLTGRPAPDAAAVGRSAVAIVVAGPHPTGLDKADVIIEEISQPVRWLAVYQSQEADGVGPVAATRPADLMALDVLRPAYAFRGGSNGHVEQVGKSQLLGVNADTSPEKFVSHGDELVVSTGIVRGAVAAPAARPMLVYGDNAAKADGAKPAKQLVVTLPGSPTQTWTYDDGAKVWRRTNGGVTVEATNLVVQVTDYKTIKLGQRYGDEVPSARVLGDGAATIAAGPVAVAGKWSKPGGPQQTNYVDAASVPVRLVPGTTFVILAPSGSTVAVS